MIALASAALLAAQLFGGKQAPATERALLLVIKSGRVASVPVNPSDTIATRPRVPPGDPPVLRFRYLDGKMRHRYGDTGLVLDDAGH